MPWAIMSFLLKLGHSTASSAYQALLVTPRYLGPRLPPPDQPGLTRNVEKQAKFVQTPKRLDNRIRNTLGHANWPGVWEIRWKRPTEISWHS